MTISDEVNLILGSFANPCTYHRNSKSKPYLCYSEFSLNDEEYKVDDFVVFKDKNKTEIGKLKCLFMNDETFQVALDKGANEKVLIHITNISNILQKTNMPSAVLDIDNQNLNSTDNFLTKNNSNSPFFELKSPSCDETPALNLTPVNGNEKRQPILDVRSITTPRRNSVKRNLNKSFGDLNYSIVGTAEENSLKVKLRKSRSCRMIENKESPSTRKSMRNIPRKSYAEFISPLKSGKEFVYSPRFSERTNKVVRSLYTNIETPKTKTMEKVNEVENLSTISTPRALKSKRAISFCESENEDELCSPLENHLNESLRTATLKVKLEKLSKKDLHEGTVKGDNDAVEEYRVKEKTEQFSPSTPRTRRNRVASVSDYSEEPCPKTPKSKRNVKPSDTMKTPSKTPRNRAKLIREGFITPSMQQRSKAVQGDSTPLMKARSQLHVSYVPKTLPCREKEYADVYGFLHGKLLDRCGGCMYVSGVPGTGKTATVTSVITNLQEDKTIPNFTFININGMKLTEPRQAYVEIMKQLAGKTVPWEQAQSMLEEIFVKSKKQKPIVMLIDELDILCTKRQDVVYNLLDWPTKAKNQLIVITIANTMDLPERLLMSRVTSRLGLTRLTFQAYTYKQLQDIVTMRLTGTNTFNPDAVQFVARKVASVSGDARRALDICRRAAEIAEAEDKFELVNMTHVNEALNMMITQPKVQAIQHCSLLEQLLLQSIVGEVERTGVEETNFGEVYRMLASHAAIEGFKMVSTTLALTAVARLGACRLILTDPKCNNIHQRIVLNVSADDVFYALKNK